MRLESVSDHSLETQKWVVSVVENLYRWYAPSHDLERIKKHLFGEESSIIDLLFDREKLAAFAVVTPRILSNGESCLWRDGTIIGEEFRSRGLYLELLRLALLRHPCAWTATRTQNPRVYETWYKIFGSNLHPCPTETPPGLLQAIASELAGPGHPFCPETFVVADAYREIRTGAEYHQCHLKWIQEFFQVRLRPRDAFMLLASTKDVHDL